MSVYAAATEVPVEKSRAEIERMLSRYKATRFASGWSENGAVILFEVHDRRIRFDLPMPNVDDPKFTRDPRCSYKLRPAEAARRSYEQACRSRWRALALVIKAKLEAVESGISEFEEEFLANIVLPNGKTVGAWMRPQVEEAYSTGKMPDMLPALGRGK